MPPYANLNTGYKSSAGWMRCHFSEDIPSFGVDGKVECCLTWQPKICWGSGWFQILQLRSKHHMIPFLYAAVRLKVWVFSLCCKTETVLQNNWTIHLEVFICDKFLFLVSMQLHATHKHDCPAVSMKHSKPCCIDVWVMPPIWFLKFCFEATFSTVCSLVAKNGYKEEGRV